jgi:sulfur carrier protein ThiS
VIRVTVRLSGVLRNRYRSGPSAGGEDVRLNRGSTVADLLEEYGIEPHKAHLIVVNRLRADLSRTLEDSDDVRVLPLAAGG